MRADVEALYRSVQALHPGMRDPQNPQFATLLESAYHRALLQSETAETYTDWREVTQGFVFSFRDGHTIFRLSAIPAVVRWPGFLVDGRRDGWVVRRPKEVATEVLHTPREDSKLLSCDGVPVKTLLHDRLDGREADLSKVPEQIRQAFRLMIDYHPDGKPPFSRCTFEDEQGTEQVSLRWERINWNDLSPALPPYLREMKRPIAVRALPSGARWIGLGSFGNESALQDVATELEKPSSGLRESPYIVFDLRGNRGGNSTWGSRFASAVWGEDAVQAKQAVQDYEDRAIAGKQWRASAAAGKEVAAIAKEFRAEGASMASVAGYWEQVAKLIQSAPQRDTQLVTDPCCSVDQSLEKPSAIPPALYSHPVYILIDAGCFSSCVLAANTLLQMGAIPVGEPSGQNEVYGEISNYISLPSGLGRYRLPLSIIRQRPESLIVLPRHRWSGAMDDDRGLEAWVQRLYEASQNAKPKDERHP